MIISFDAIFFNHNIKKLLQTQHRFFYNISPRWDHIFQGVKRAIENEIVRVCRKNILSSITEYKEGKSNVTAQVLLSSSIKMLSRIVKYIFCRHNPISFHSSYSWISNKKEKHHLLEVRMIKVFTSFNS